MEVLERIFGKTDKASAYATAMVTVAEAEGASRRSSSRSPRRSSRTPACVRR
jgi:hypothetical protein